MTSYGRSSTDSLPKVIVCGLTENNMPKLLVCDDRNKRDSERVCKGPCSQDGPFQQSAPRKPPNKPRPPNVGSFGVPALSQLQSDLRQKQQAIDNLTRTLCCLQCEMDHLAQQNTMLNEQIQQTMANTPQESGKKRFGKNYTCLEDRLNEFDENTKFLEKQVFDMETNVQAMKTELTAVQADRLNREQKPKVVMIHPPGWCNPRTQPCRIPRPASCPYKPSCH